MPRKPFFVQGTRTHARKRDRPQHLLIEKGPQWAAREIQWFVQEQSANPLSNERMFIPRLELPATFDHRVWSPPIPSEPFTGAVRVVDTGGDRNRSITLSECGKLFGLRTKDAKGRISVGGWRFYPYPMWNIIEYQNGDGNTFKLRAWVHTIKAEDFLDAQIVLHHPQCNQQMEWLRAYAYAMQQAEPSHRYAFAERAQRIVEYWIKRKQTDHVTIDYFHDQFWWALEHHCYCQRLHLECRHCQGTGVIAPSYEAWKAGLGERPRPITRH